MFLGYLTQWLTRVNARPGFTKTERNKMLLSHQTQEGITMTGKMNVIVLLHEMPF